MPTTVEQLRDPHRPDRRRPPRGHLQPAGARSRRLSRRRPAAVFAEDPAREPAAPRGRRVREGGRHPGAGLLGREERPRSARSRSCRRASCCRTSPACPASSISPPCATASCASAAIRIGSTRCSRSSWSSTTRCRSTTSAQADAFQLNAELEFARNQERYAFLRWGQNAFRNFRVVPPDTGIVHQVNLEYLARVVVSDDTADGAGRLSRHARRHRLAHDDGQRPGRGRAGAWAASRPRRRCSASRCRC